MSRNQSQRHDLMTWSENCWSIVHQNWINLYISSKPRYSEYWTMFVSHSMFCCQTIQTRESGIAGRSTRRHIRSRILEMKRFHCCERVMDVLRQPFAYKVVNL
jgi:hypothetical protein